MNVAPPDGPRPSQGTHDPVGFFLFHVVERRATATAAWTLTAQIGKRVAHRLTGYEDRAGERCIEVKNHEDGRRYR
jgi:hypothetical protein